MDWPVLIGIGTIIGSILASVGGFIKNRADAKVGVRSATREDQAALDARYQQIFDEVRESLIDPLRAEVERLRGEVDQLRADLREERSELKEERARYRAALSHIRAWTVWGSLHAAPGAAAPPDPPERIVDDLH